MNKLWRDKTELGGFDVNTWALTDTKASIEFARGTLEFQMSPPDLGFRYVRQQLRETLCQLVSTDEHPLPTLQESYCREADLLAEYPQGATDRFGLMLELLVRTVAAHSVLEMVVAVQTTLLDCHPMLDILFSGQQPERTEYSGISTEFAPPPSVQAAQDLQRLAAPITQLKTSADDYLAVMLPPRDWPVTGYRTEPKCARYRLFEEFLEKGVIRKSRLWFVATSEKLEPAELMELYAGLCEIPLPLST